jgi:DNA-binding NtrC family response regulator
VLKRPFILIVDNDEFVLISAETLLSEDFQVVSVSSAEKALESMKAREFSVILIDISLEGKSGIWLLKEIKSRNIRSELIMITGDDNPEQIRQCYALGAFGYVVKPWNIRDTSQLVRRANDKYQKFQKKVAVSRAGRVPKPKLTKLSPDRLKISELVAPIANRLKNIDKSTMSKIGQAQDELKRQILVLALQKVDWNQVHAAKLLGIKRTTLRQNLGALGIIGPTQRRKRSFS